MNPSIQALDGLQKAREARTAGNEGKARVLCRLAAASAIKEFLAKTNRPAPPRNAYETILYFSQTNSLPAPLRIVLSHLLLRVDEDYNLPEGIDLISDSEQLIQFFESSKDL